LGDAFGVPTTGVFAAFGLTTGALDRGEFAGGGIVATHADKTTGNVTLSAPLTTVLIMDSPGFIVVTLAAWFFTQKPVCWRPCTQAAAAFAGVIPGLGFAGAQRRSWP